MRPKSFIFLQLSNHSLSHIVLKHFCPTTIFQACLKGDYSPRHGSACFSLLQLISGILKVFLKSVATQKLRKRYQLKSIGVRLLDCQFHNNCCGFDFVRLRSIGGLAERTNPLIWNLYEVFSPTTSHNFQHRIILCNIVILHVPQHCCCKLDSAVAGRCSIGGQTEGIFLWHGLEIFQAPNPTPSHNIAHHRKTFAYFVLGRPVRIIPPVCYADFITYCAPRGCC